MTADDDFHNDDHDHGVKPDGGEDWISSEPPIDDFGDEAHAEQASVSEGNEQDGDAHMEPAAEEKKKFPFLLLIGAIGSLAVVGALAYWHFGAQQTSILDQVAQNATPAMVPNFAPKPVAVEKPAAPAAVVANDVAPKTSFSPPSMDIDTAKSSSVAAATVDAPVPELVPVAPTPAPVKGAAAEKPVVAPVIVQPIIQPVAQISPAQDEKLASLSSRIDDLQKALSHTVQELGQINDKLNEKTLAQPAAVQADPAIAERLDKLEQKLTQLEQQPKTIATTPAAIVETTSTSTVRSYAPHSAKHAKHVKAVAHHKAAKVAAKSGKWVLRAATPGEAWIAASAETRELRPVHVGDDVKGLGKVTAIKEAGDGWVVETTHGAIH